VLIPEAIVSLLVYTMKISREQAATELFSRQWATTKEIATEQAKRQKKLLRRATDTVDNGDDDNDDCDDDSES
jgi:hypothetical protein